MISSIVVFFLLEFNLSGIQCRLSSMDYTNYTMATDDKARLFQDIERHKEGIYVLLHELVAAVPQHVHSQGHILVVLDGVATINVERSDYYIPNGYFVWIPSGVPHRISFEGKRVRFLNIYYPAGMKMAPFYQRVGVYPMTSILYHTIELVKEHTDEYDSDDWRFELMVTLNHILPHTIQNQKFQLRLPTTDHPMGMKIMESVHQNYQRQFTAEELAQEVGLSVRSLSRYVRNELDVSLVQYVRIYRVIMAIKQMVKGDESITNIAYNVGYESLTAFSNAFYKVTGCRPSQFLKEGEK